MSEDKRRLQQAEAQLAQEEQQRRCRESAPAAPRPDLAPEKPPSRMLVFATVTFYLVAAIVMVFANKAVLNSVPVPLTFLFGQLAIAVLLLHCSACLGYFSLVSLKLATCKALTPLICINVLGLAFNTFCLQYVDASFYQVARGLVLPFTTLASYVFLGTRSSGRVLMAVMLVCFGFIYGVSSERFTVSHLGVILGIFSSMTTSLHAIVVKRSLHLVPDAVELAYYCNLLSALVIFPFILVSGEGTVFLDIVLQGGNSLKTLVTGTVVTGVFGFLICIAGLLSIKITSPVTHMVSSAVRGVLQTALGYWVFNDHINSGRIGGIGFIVIGSLYYTWVKDKELSQSKQQYQAISTASPHIALAIHHHGPGNGTSSTLTSASTSSSTLAMSTYHRTGDEEFELTKATDGDMDDDEKELMAAVNALKKKSGTTSPNGAGTPPSRRASFRC